MKKEKLIFGWHFLPTDRRLTHGDGRKVIAGQTLSVECTPECTEAGLHSAPTVSDAVQPHASGPILCRVASWGEIDEEDDMLSAKNRHVLWTLDATNILREHAAWCAQWALEQELSHGRDVDPRSRAAVDTAFAFAEGNCTSEQLEKARDAAWDAAWDADADAARDAAWSAALRAACAAAWCAAWSVASAAATFDAARSAARAAAKSIFDAWLDDVVLDEAKSLGVFIEDYDPRKAK